MKPVSSNLVWLDLEMTGLDPRKDRIIEIATVVTSKHLEIVAEGPVIAIHQRPSVLKKMDAWNVKHHTKSGLVERVKKSRIDEKEAEAQTLEFLIQHVSQGKSPICGNSVYQDRRFLFRYMTLLEKFFHYRLLDVSTIKILAKQWYPKIAGEWKKTSNHQALQDVYSSINELRYYREHLFNRLEM